VQENVRQALSELRRQFGALFGDRLTRLILYGSQARGDARPWSDIDVLAVLKGPVDDYKETIRTEVIVGDICLEFDVVIICIFMSEARYLAGEGPLLRNVNAEGVPV
jgi:predicted nucleotidyltransferase